MRYENISPAVFISRPNRFIANVEIDGKIFECHVKNTGRCKELLLSGTKVFVNNTNNPKRRTKYDLIAVCKGDVLVNMDSQAPNKVVYEWINANGLLGSPANILKPEYRFGDSRIDFYAETDKGKYLIEVKGVTLEEDGIAKFPDAPTQRGVRHINELIKSADIGYLPMIIFVIQLDAVKAFRPNWKTHPEFGKALQRAKEKGVRILAMDCYVAPDSLSLKSEIPIELQHEPIGNLKAKGKDK